MYLKEKKRLGGEERGGKRIMAGNIHKVRRLAAIRVISKNNDTSRNRREYRIALGHKTRGKGAICEEKK